MSTLFLHSFLSVTCREHYRTIFFVFPVPFLDFCARQAMAEPSTAPKKAARTFDFEAMMAQARSGAQERSKVDWSTEIEKTKEENEQRIAEMKLKADHAAKQMEKPSGTRVSTNDDADEDDDDFGPAISLATTSHADNEGDTSDEDDDNNNAVQVRTKKSRSRSVIRASLF